MQAAAKRLVVRPQIELPGSKSWKTRNCKQGANGTKTVSIHPAADGWAVRSDAIENDLIVKHGSKAEETAKRLALAKAEADQTTEIRIQLRNGSIAARFIGPANEAQSLMRAGGRADLEASPQ